MDLLISKWSIILIQGIHLMYERGIRPDIPYEELHSRDSLSSGLSSFLPRLHRGHACTLSRWRRHKIRICFFLLSWSRRRTARFLSIYLLYTDLWTTRYDFRLRLIRAGIIFPVCVLLPTILYTWTCTHASIRPCCPVFMTYNRRADNDRNSSCT